MKILSFFLVTFAILIAGCGSSNDSRVHLGSVKNDTIVDNYITRPVAVAFSALLGEGISVTNVVTKRNDADLLEVHITGYNESRLTKRFRYRVEWLDDSGSLVETKTSVWLPMSAMPQQPFNFKVVAPRPEAVNFRMDTRRWE